MTINDLDDSTLWERTRGGDVDAFTALFWRHGTAIYNYCFRLLGDWSAAEDAVSIVFLEAWRRRDKRLPPDKVLPWFYGVATNVVRNRRRAERRWSAALTRIPATPTQPDFAEEIAERVDDERQMKRALQLVTQLPRREREVFVLCAWADLTYDDAAIALSVPVGTVRSRLSRARQHLRELDPSYGHEQRQPRKPVREVSEP